jgi:hypothetical protein
MSYVQQVSQNGTWLVTAFGAAATFLVGKLGFDQIGNGDYSHYRWLGLLASVVVLAGGFLVLLLGVVMTTVAPRTRLGWLHSDDGAGLRHELEREMWWFPGAAMLPGCIDGDGELTTGNALTAFEVRYARLMAQQFVDAAELSEDDQFRIALMQGARDSLLDTVVAERLEDARPKALGLIFAGALIAVLGATGFAFVTNQATRVGAKLDKAATVTAGELLPKSESPVQLVADKLVDADKAKLGDTCDLSRTTIDGVLVEIATPPDTTLPRDDVMHVVTVPSGTCTAADLWLPPDAVIPRASAGGAGGGRSSTTPTTAAAASSTPTTGG